MTAQNTSRHPSEPPEPQTFSGFDIPRQNWFKMPNDWTNITADITSLAELKVVEYVLKHTWGYQEYGLKKRISIDEFMSGRRRVDGSRIDKGTGLSKPSVVSGIKAAVKRGLLIEEKDDSDKGRIKKYYILKMRAGDDPNTGDEPGNPDHSPPIQEEDDLGERSFTPDVKNLNRGVKNLYPRCKNTLHRTEQDTLGRHLQERTATRAREDNNNNTGDTPVDEPEDKTDVVVALSEQGISKKVAQRLADHYSRERILEKIEFVQFLVDEKPDQIQNPRGWLRKAIEEDYGPPDGFISQEEGQRIKEEKKRQEEAAEAVRREMKNRDERKKTAQAEQKAAFEQSLAQEWGTDEQDRELWAQVKMALQQQQFSPMLLACMHLLKWDNNVAKIGVTNPIATNQLRHPNTIIQVEREFKFFTKQTVKIELIEVGSPAYSDPTSDQDTSSR